MADEELGALECFEVCATRRHEVNRSIDLTGQLLVSGVGGVLREALIPAVHFAKVGKAALGERANEIERCCRRVVPVDHAVWVGAARLRREVIPVDNVASVSGKRHTIAGFGVARTRLGELPCHASHLDHGHLCRVSQHNSHLQNRLDAVTNLVGGCSGKGLGTIAALKQKRMPRSRVREPGTQCVNLTGKNQRRKPSEGCTGARHFVAILPVRLLLNGQVTPCVEAGKGGGVCRGSGLRITHRFKTT